MEREDLGFASLFSSLPIGILELVREWECKSAFPRL